MVQIFYKNKRLIKTTNYYSHKNSPLYSIYMYLLLTYSVHSFLQTNDATESSIYALSLCHYGNWLAETKSQNPLIILEKYLQKVHHMCIPCTTLTHTYTYIYMYSISHVLLCSHVWMYVFVYWLVITTHYICMSVYMYMCACLYLHVCQYVCYRLWICWRICLMITQ